MIKARELYKDFGYKKWENFNNNIEKAIQLYGNSEGVTIEPTVTPQSIGSGAVRLIKDYVINEQGVEVIKKLCGSMKPLASIPVRNEVAICSQLIKYFSHKNIKTKFQYRLTPFVFDLQVGSVFFEFDEQYHSGKVQSNIDKKKTEAATMNGFTVVRGFVTDDIVDIIIRIEEALTKNIDKSK